jgi:hypothetical protein
VVVGGAVSKAIFTTKAEPVYDDLPEFRYHFPRTYLRQVEAAVGDWIIYYEPRRISADLGSRGGRQAYFAAARVTTVQADPRVPDHFYAFVADFLQFDRPVPFREGDRYYEASLQRPDGSTSKGAFGRSVRPITDAEFDLIVRAGFEPLLAPASSADEVPTGLSFSEAAALDDNYTILTAKGRVPEPVRRLINPDGRLSLPPRPEVRPHPQFLRYHRENVFRG